MPPARGLAAPGPGAAGEGGHGRGNTLLSARQQRQQERRDYPHRVAAGGCRKGTKVDRAAASKIGTMQPPRQPRAMYEGGWQWVGCPWCAPHGIGGLEGGVKVGR